MHPAWGLSSCPAPLQHPSTGHCPTSNCGWSPARPCYGTTPHLCRGPAMHSQSVCPPFCPHPAHLRGFFMCPHAPPLQAPLGPEFGWGVAGVVLLHALVPMYSCLAPPQGSIWPLLGASSFHPALQAEPLLGVSPGAPNTGHHGNPPCTPRLTAGVFSAHPRPRRNRLAGVTVRLGPSTRVPLRIPPPVWPPPPRPYPCGSACAP